VAVRTATKGFINFGFWFLKIPAHFFAGIFLLLGGGKIIRVAIVGQMFRKRKTVT
jgi:hypothetical protein